MWTKKQDTATLQSLERNEVKNYDNKFNRTRNESYS
jgi:hypothetical protein